MFRRKRRTLSDFEAEIQSHLAHEADQLRESNACSDPEGEARRSFGNPTAVKEAFYEHGRWQLWDHFSRDLRHSWRLFWRRPAFTAVVVLTLAVGLGATLAIFGVIDAVLLRPLPYKDPGRLGMLWTEDSAHGFQEGRVSLFNFADWKARARTFDGMTIFIGQTFLFGNNDGSTERMRSARVDENFFPLLGVTPLLGRVFSPAEVQRGEHVAVLSYTLWVRHFGGSPHVLDTDLTMDNRKLRIVGVMPAEFQYPFPDTQVWEPVTVHPYWTSRDRAAPRSDSNWFALGRLREGARWSQAQAEMSGIARQLLAEHPENRLQPEIRVVPLDDQSSGRLRRPLVILFGSVILMLLIACLNVANLLLARGSAREREFSLRRALGASRKRVAAQLLIESMVLSAAGGILGLAIAAGALKALIAFGPKEIPRLGEARIDSSVLAFTFAITFLASLISGLAPALRNTAAPSRSREWLTTSARSVRNVLVVGEFAIALVLLTGAGLMVRSFVQLRGVDPGFRPERLLSMRIDLHLGRTSAQQVAYFQQAIERVQEIPGVRSAAAISGFLRSDPEDSVMVEGRAPQQPGPCDDLIAGPFFEAAGIPILKGRAINSQDRRDTQPVAVINEAMARAYWPGEDPVGKRFRYPGHSRSPWVTVVGVAGDMRRQDVARRPIPQVFRPHAQDSENMMDVIVRTSVDAAPMAEAIRRQIQQIDRGVPRFKIEAVAEQVGEQTAERRFQTSLISLFSLIALFLSAIGIYGLMHFFVVQRTHEIGVRMALGARYGNVVAMVMRQGVALAGVGIGAGMLLALALTRLLATLLYGVTPTDPVTFTLAPAILLCVAVIACWLPATRAARVDPMRALRQD
jgi:putative ABC transport system permease protein